MKNSLKKEKFNEFYKYLNKQYDNGKIKIFLCVK